MARRVVLNALGPDASGRRVRSRAAPVRPGAVAGLVVVLVVLLVVPVGGLVAVPVAATAGPGSGDPVPGTAPRPPRTTSTTTAVTTTVPAPSTTLDPTTSTTAPAGDDVPAPTEPGEVPGPRLPRDSELAALADLARVRAEAERLGLAIGTVDRMLTRARARLRTAQGGRAAAARRRAARAVAAYRDQSSGWRVRGAIPDSLERARAILLLGRADHHERRRLRVLEARIDRLRRRIRDAVAVRNDLVGQRTDLARREQVLVEKLASVAGDLRLVAPGGAEAPGPDRIAGAADEARRAFDRLPAAGTDPAAARAWTEARRALAQEVAASPWVTGRVPVRAVDEALAAAPPWALRVVLFALTQVGKPYVYATAGPATYDCSGLTKRAWQEAGIGLPHFSGAQLRLGVPVPADQLRPGDLLAYGPGGTEHVTMAIGAGLVVEARGRAAGVIVAPVRTDPERHGFAGAVRFLP